MKKISERASELFEAHEEKREFPQLVARETLADALDEWQASVEERLEGIGLGVMSATPAEHVLAQGKQSSPSFEMGTGALLGYVGPACFDEEKPPAQPIVGDEPWNHWCASPCGVDGCEGSGNRDSEDGQ